MKFLIWIFRLIPAIILLQTLYFKFTGAPESVYIFQTVGMEPWGRYASGVAELIAAVLIMIPRYSWLGALMTLGVLSGALFFHLTKLGVVVMDDGGQLFIYALTAWICAFIVLVFQRKDIPLIGKVF